MMDMSDIGDIIAESRRKIWVEQPLTTSAWMAAQRWSASNRRRRRATAVGMDGVTASDASTKCTSCSAIERFWRSSHLLNGTLSGRFNRRKSASALPRSKVDVKNSS